MIFEWHFEEYGLLRPLRPVAQLLAEREDWPALYDLDRLADNEVPAVAAIYAQDMYVERGLSEAVAGKIGGLQTWVTEEFEHNGLRAHGDRVLDRLFGMLAQRR